MKLRYVSPRKATPKTPAERVEEIRKTIPPPAGRKARNPYISKDDFADLLGAGRTTVINWTLGKSFPEERYRAKLAELSGGRYAPEDFQEPNGQQRGTGSLERRIAALEAAIGQIEQRLSEAIAAQDR